MTKTKYLALLIVVLMLLSATGCSQRRVRAAQGDKSEQVSATQNTDQMGPPLPPGPVKVDQSNDVMGPPVPMGPLPPADFNAPKDGYVLVLGPGLARALSFLGVLREFERDNLKINAIYGVEMGAVIGTIWASSNSNNLEWVMHNFKRDTLFDPPLLGLRSHVAEGKKLYSFLEESVKVGLLQKTKIPDYVVSAVPGAESVLIESNGSAKDILRGAMSIPGVIKSYIFEDKDRETAALEKPFPVAEAKSLGLGKVLCVDVVGRGDNFKPKDSTEQQLATLMRSVASLARQSLKECDAVISVPVDGIGYLNFESRADLVYQGKLAARKWLEQPK